MHVDQGKKHKSIFCQITFAWFLLGSVALSTTSSDVAPNESLQGTEWVNQLVTPQKNVSLSQILGQWYTVEIVRNFSFLPEDMCETFDFFLSADNTSVLVNLTLSMGQSPLNFPVATVLPDASWELSSQGYKVLDVSADGGLLSLARCSSLVSSCYGAVLARDPDLSGRDDSLLAVHRGLGAAGLSDTRVGHRQRPDACRPGAPVAGYQSVKNYDV